MASRARALGLVGAVVMVSLGLSTPARAWAEADRTASGVRLLADTRWDQAYTLRLRAAETPAAPAETATPTFRSGSIDASGAPGARQSLVLTDRVWMPREYVEAEVSPASRPGRGGDWIEVVVPAERDLGLFLAAQSALLLDMAQTLEINGSPDFKETNRLLGERPSDGAVLAYFGSIAALHAASYLTLDGRWANVVSRAVLFVQVPAIDNNARLGVRISF
ncbi:MAG TPA: hypothetical protein VIM86_11250 [Thermodesulfobacteriota bacterium]